MDNASSLDTRLEAEMPEVYNDSIFLRKLDACEQFVDDMIIYDVVDEKAEKLGIHVCRIELLTDEEVEDIYDPCGETLRLSEEQLDQLAQLEQVDQNDVC